MTVLEVRLSMAGWRLEEEKALPGEKRAGMWEINTCSLRMTKGAGGM